MPLASPSLVYVPTPATWAVAQRVRAPLLRSDVGGAVQLLANPPFFSGQDTVTLTSVPDTTDQPVAIDTESADPYGGHLDTGAGNAKWYGMLPGWYLAESTVPFNSQAGGGSCGAGVGVSLAGGAVTAYYGQRMPISSGTGYSMPVCAKLVRISSAGILGGASNDYVTALARQNSGSPISVLSTASKSAGLQLRWISALAGTPGLIVPPLDAPPSLITSAWLNRNARDAIAFLLYPPMCELYDAGTATSITSQTSFPGAGQQVGLDTAFADPWSAFSAGAGTWTVPRSGLYYLYGNAGVNAGGNSLSVGAGITVTSPLYDSGQPVTIWGGAQATVASAGNAAVVRRRVRLLQGDTLALACFQRDSGSASATVVTGLTAQSPCRMIAIWRAL
jgi:hypothetical protein